MPADIQIRKLDRNVPEDLDAAIEVAQIRNMGREWYTVDTDWISPFEQMAWFLAEPQSLWVAEKDGEVVGYALLTDRDGKVWVSLGVHPDYQGQGIGTCLYARFFDVWAEIRKDNVASIRAAEKAGYRVVYEADGKVVMHQ